MIRLIGLNLIFTVTGCAAMQADYTAQIQDHVCNEDGSYQAGMNDARAHKPMNSGFVSVCSAETKDVARKGYRVGYETGLKSLRDETPATQINVNVGGDNSSANTFYCEIHAFTQTFSAWGATELQAQMKAKAQCTKKYHEMHCSEFECKH